MNSLIPRSFFMPSLWDEEDSVWTMSSQPSGLSVSEDKDHVYVEAQVPGVDPDKIEVTFDKGVLWIKAHQESQEKNEEKKFYRKSVSSFSYNVKVPETVNLNIEPQAVCKNGVIKLSFDKTPEVQPKKISVRKE
jgi:HSP20 family protein